MERGKCRSCGAAILWLRSATTNALLPLDHDPIDGGNIAILDGLAHTLSGSMFEPMMDGPRYRGHWEKCPNVEHQQKPRAKGK